MLLEKIEGRMPRLLDTHTIPELQFNDTGEQAKPQRIPVTLGI